jgi:DnaJ domain
VNIRHAFQERTKRLLDHFSSCMLSKESVAVQLLNDFPRWSVDELAFVALHCGIPNATLERAYLKSFRLFREQRQMEQKHLRKAPEIVNGAIQEIEGQAWERPSGDKAKQSMGGNTFGGASPEDVLEEIRKAGLDQGANGQSWNEFLKAFAGSKKGKTQTREEAMDAARKAKQGRGTYGDTFQEAQEKERARKAGGNPHADMFSGTGAPGYLRAHLQVLELTWPTTREEAKAKHREMVKKHHPDVGGSNDKFQQIQSAWERLSEYLDQLGK